MRVYTDHAPCAVICQPTILHPVSSFHCLSGLSGPDRSNHRAWGRWLEQTKSSRTAPVITSWVWEKAWQQKQSKPTKIKSMSLTKWAETVDQEPCFRPVQWSLEGLVYSCFMHIDISVAYSVPPSEISKLRELQFFYAEGKMFDNINKWNIVVLQRCPSLQTIFSRQ